MAREVACKLPYILCEVGYQAVEGLRVPMSRTSTANCGTMLTSSMHSRPYYAIRSSGLPLQFRKVYPQWQQKTTFQDQIDDRKSLLCRSGSGLGICDAKAFSLPGPSLQYIASH